MSVTPHKRLEIIRGVKVENLLRTEVLIPLFQNMSQFEQVIDNHGASEKGTDIILVEKGTFGGYRYTSVVVKALAIGNATTPQKQRDTAANVAEQVRLAIFSGHYCNLQNRLVTFNTVLVITNQRISNTARETLIGEGKKWGFNDVKFYVDDDLLGLIDKFLPNFYYYHSGIHARIASSLREKCERLSDLKNLQQFSGEERALLDVFVKPRLQRLESRYVEGAKQNQLVIETPDVVINHHTRLLVIGEAGSGKSIILREAVLTMLSQNTRDSKPLLPLLVKAHDLAKSAKKRFLEILNEIIQRYYSLPEFDFEAAGKDAELVLLIDGLDEITDMTRREEIKSHIINFSNDHPNVRTIVTSRRTKDTIDINSMPSFQRWDVLEFNFGQVREFISKWFGDRQESSNRLLAALSDHDLLSKLPNTPLVLTLLAILFDSDDYREIPSNLTELYRMFLDLLMGRWNLDRRVETIHNANIREYLATEIALTMHRNKSISIDRQQFNQIVENTAATRGFSIDSDVLLNELMEQSALLVLNDRDQLEFRHLSFQEFLVAVAIHSRSLGKEVDFLIEHFEQSWWTKVLYFYCGLRHDTPEVLERILDRFPDMESPQRMFVMFELGYLIQAAYLTPIATRMNVVKAVLYEFPLSLASLPQVSIQDKALPSGIKDFAFTFWLSMQFASKMLQKHFLVLFDEMKTQKIIDENDSFAILALAIIIAQNNDFTPLSEVHNVIKVYPKQMMTLTIAGQVLLENLTPLEKQSNDVKEFRSTWNKVRKWFRQHSDIARGLMDTPNPELGSGT